MLSKKPWPSPQKSRYLLEIEKLEAGFVKNGQVIQALYQISYEVEEGEILAIAGESGSGKTLTALGILRLWPKSLERLGGNIRFEGRDIFSFGEKELNHYRGGQVAMIFQEPMTALNPVFSVGFQIEEVLRSHHGLSKKEAREVALSLLQKVGISEPKLRSRQYPFELSGGMRQRVMIAMALAGNPKLLLADEPTTALDVTIQAQILNLIRELNQKDKMAVVLISHDLGIVAQMSHKIAIMYAGRIVEKGPTKEVFLNPAHPYTQGLLESRPQRARKKLRPIPGQIPSLTHLPKGCAFYDRCFAAKPICQQKPPLKQRTNGHVYLCHF
ncbi:MAG: ABC transporter ATP-binding protein [Leptospiraceae bacterium]|nr:ABC transporter ATP-binding protein [Leptospiraceae bacterium]MDW8307113.1 ABC transporter ATP-binding protein [Leptospiraceae bacterium]